jgi:hypothetical protein
MKQAKQVARVWSAIVTTHFFNLAPHYEHPGIGGAPVSMTVTANGRVHSVSTLRSPHKALAKIFAALNAATPAEAEWSYY